MILSASTLIGGLGSVAGTVIALTGGGLSWLVSLLSVPLAAVYVASWVRFPFVGITLTPDEAVFTSWWRTRRVKKEDVVRWYSDSYTGVLNVVGWPVASGAAEAGQVCLETADGERRSIPGTVTWRSTALKQARALNEWRSHQRVSPSGPDSLDGL